MRCTALAATTSAVGTASMLEDPAAARTVCLATSTPVRLRTHARACMLVAHTRACTHPHAHAACRMRCEFAQY